MSSRTMIDALTKRDILDRLIMLIHAQLDNDDLWTELSGNVYLSYDIVWQYHDKPWDWYIMSENDNIPVSDALTDMNMPWNWSMLSLRATWADIQEHPDAPWSWHDVSENPNITMEIITANPDAPWRWMSVSRNKNVTWAMVVANMTKPWCWSELSKRIDMNIIWQHPNHLWCAESMSENPSVAFADVIGHPDVEWNYKALSENTRITFDDIISTIDRRWCWNTLSQRSDVTIDVIKAVGVCRWDFMRLSSNRCITMEMIHEMRNQRWHTYCLADNPALSADMVIACSQYKFWPVNRKTGKKNLGIMSGNRNVTFSYVQQHLDIDWDYDELSSNRSILLQNILTGKHVPWNMSRIVANKLDLEYTITYERIARRHMAVYKIQIVWRRCINNPLFRMCHKTQTVKFILM